MRNRFDAQLEQLHQKLIEMGNLCEQVISMTYKVLVDEDYEAARELIEKDSRIDLKERDIEGLTGYTDRPDGRGYRTDGDRQRERLCMAGFGYGPKSDRV